MSNKIPQLLRQLWQQKSGVNPTGMVAYHLKAERTLRELHKAFAGVANLLVVRLDAIGDNFIFFDSYRKLRELFPKTNIVVITYAENQPIYDRCPFVNKTLYVDRTGLNSNKAYRETCFQNLRECPQPWDLLINPLYSREYVAEEIVAAAPAGVKIGVGGDNSNISRQVMAMTDAAYAAFLPVDNSVVRHELHRNNEILSLLGSQDGSIHFTAPLTAEDRRFAGHLIGEYHLGNYGVVFPGTKGGTQSIKYWGSDNYASVIDWLKLEAGIEAVMMLGPVGEETILNEISAAARTTPCAFPGDLSLWQAAALLERAKFYIGSDTSVAHIAAALKVPTFVLLGGGHFGRFFPYPEGSSVNCLTHKLDCFNCYWKCKQTYNKCIADISVTEVIEAVSEHLPPRQPAAENNFAGFNLGKIHGSRPRVDLVFTHGLHGWHLREALTMTLEKAGCLNRVFRVSPDSSGPLFKYLKTGGEADFILAMGGDHHLWFLHDTEEKRAFWRQYRGLRVCNSFESTRDSLYKKYVPRVTTALEAFTHFVHSDEVDAPIFEHAGVKSLWWPQATDHRMFAADSPSAKRLPKVFFCGKLWNEYPMRKAIIEALQSANLVASTSGISTGELVLNYNRFMFAINPPGVLGGFNVRAFEAMSCGSLMLQFLPSGRPRNNALFEHGKHLFYFDGMNPKGLRELVQQAIAHPDEAAAIAERGREETLAHHTLEIRLRQLVEWLFDQKEPAYPQYGLNEAARAESLKRRYVNDRYLSEGRFLSNPEAVNEFSDLQFLAYHSLLPRFCQQGEQLAASRREVEALRLFKRALDSDSDPDQAHNNLGVIYWQRGQRHRALEHFAAAVAENPRYRPAIINYGEALALSGQAGQSRRVYSDYLQLNTPDTGIKTLLEAAN